MNNKKNPAEQVIERFGGQSSLGSLLGKRQSTVQHWAKTGRIPSQWHERLLELSHEKGIGLEPLIHGGKQESGLRAGTENVPSIVGLGKAAELALHAIRDSARIKELRDKLEEGIKKLVPDARLNGHRDNRLPNTLNLTLPGLRGESLVVALDQHGISLSSGSACKSGSPEPTHVLMAMGKTEQDAHCSVRFSLSRDTAEEDIDETVSALAQVLEEKNTVRLIPCK